MKNTISQKLKEKGKSMDWLRKEIDEPLGVIHSHSADQVTLSLAVKIAEVLGCTIFDLWPTLIKPKQYWLKPRPISELEADFQEERMAYEDWRYPDNMSEADQAELNEKVKIAYLPEATPLKPSFDIESKGVSEVVWGDFKPKYPDVDKEVDNRLREDLNWHL